MLASRFVWIPDRVRNDMKCIHRGGIPQITPQESISVGSRPKEEHIAGKLH